MKPDFFLILLAYIANAENMNFSNITEGDQSSYKLERTPIPNQVEIGGWPCPDEYFCEASEQTKQCMCKKCTICADGKQPKKGDQGRCDGETFKDRECETCPSHQFSNDTGSCHPCKVFTCPQGERLLHECDAYNDGLCSQCEAGEFHVDTGCEKCSCCCDGSSPVAACLIQGFGVRNSCPYDSCDECKNPPSTPPPQSPGVKWWKIAAPVLTVLIGMFLAGAVGMFIKKKCFPKQRMHSPTLSRRTGSSSISGSGDGETMDSDTTGLLQQGPSTASGPPRLPTTLLATDTYDAVSVEGSRQGHLRPFPDPDDN